MATFNTAKDSRTVGAAQLPKPAWFEDAVFYKLPVKAFCDASGDGSGDFRGLAAKADVQYALRSASSELTIAD